MSRKAHSIPVLLAAACLMVLGLPPMSVQADPLVSDTFDTYTSGEPPVPPWNESYYGSGSEPPYPPVYTREEAAAMGVTIEIDQTISVSGKSLHFSDTTGNVGSSLMCSFPAATRVIVEYYMRTHNESYEGAFVALEGPDGQDYQAGFSSGAYTGKAGYIGIHGSPAGWVKNDLLEYQEDTWYLVRRELNCASQTGSFYVEEVGNPSNHAYYEIGPNHPGAYVDRIAIWTAWSVGADAYVDELTVTGLSGGGVVPEPLSMASMASAFVGVVGWRAWKRRKAGR